MKAENFKYHSNVSGEWYTCDIIINGNSTTVYHRIDGPALIYNNGSTYWYLYGKPHRENGPAIEMSNGIKFWYLHGQEINCQTQEEFESLIKLKSFW